MKQLIVLLASFFYLQNGIGQVATGGMGGSLDANSGNFFLVNLKSAHNADAFNPDIYANVEGSPYLSPDWLYARIKLSDDRNFDSVLIKVNFFENKIHFRDEDGKERMVAIPVKELEITDSRSPLNKSVFVTGYGDDTNEFYQAIADGKKAGLLKKMKVVIREHKVFNAPVQKKFESDAVYYVYANKGLYEQNKNCSSLFDAFRNDSKVMSFVSSKDIKCNKEKDLKLVVDYYNSY